MHMSFTMNIQTINDVTVIYCSGKITASDGVKELTGKFLDLLNTGRRKILLNFQETPYVDSAGLGCIVSGFELMKKNDGAIKLVYPTKRFKDLIQITKMRSVFEIFDDQSAAIASFCS